MLSCAGVHHATLPTIRYGDRYVTETKDTCGLEGLSLSVRLVLEA